MLQAITLLPAIAIDTTRTFCLAEGGVLQTICLLLILVDTESTVCPEKGRVSRTSNSKSTTLSRERRVSTDESHCRDNKNQEKLLVALFRIHQRIMGEQRSDAENTKRL